MSCPQQVQTPMLETIIEDTEKEGLTDTQGMTKSMKSRMMLSSPHSPDSFEVSFPRPTGFPDIFNNSSPSPTHHRNPISVDSPIITPAKDEIKL